MQAGSENTGIPACMTVSGPDRLGVPGPAMLLGSRGLLLAR